MDTMTKKQLDDAIKKLAGAQSKLAAEIHRVLCHATMHALGAGSGDVSAFDSILAATKGSDRKAIMVWAKEFAPVQFLDGKAKLNKGKFKAMREDGAVTLQALLDGVTYLDYVPTVKQINAAFDVDARLAALFNGFDNAVAAGKEIKNAGLVEYLKTAAIRYHSECMQSEAIRPAQELQVAA